MYYYHCTFVLSFYDPIYAKDQYPISTNTQYQYVPSQQRISASAANRFAIDIRVNVPPKHQQYAVLATTGD
ncbi:MAG: hypothetical protein ACRCUH_05480 [Shewanella sp.]